MWSVELTCIIFQSKSYISLAENVLLTGLLIKILIHLANGIIIDAQCPL